MRNDKLVVDDGERSLAAYLETELPAGVLSIPLPAYDLMWYGQGEGEVHLAERKTASDLLASIMDDRLLDETQRAHDQGAHLWLLVSGQVAPWRGGVRAYWGTHKAEYAGIKWEHTREFDMVYDRVLAHLLDLQYWCGVTVVQALDDKQLAHAVAQLWKRRLTPPTPRLWRPGVTLMRRNPVAAAYMTYEGVGEKTALALEQSYPSEQLLAVAPDDDVRRVEGVGPKRLAAIRKRLGGGNGLR